MVRAEQERILNPNKELPKGEVIFSEQSTLSKLLGIKPGEEGETKDLLNNVPFDFEIRDMGKSLLHIVSFSQAQPVGLSELFRLLQTAKPGGRSRNGQSLSGVQADWRIILPAVREEELRARELYGYHRQHVPGFLEFEEKHFPLFWNVLQSGLPRHEEVNFFSDRFKRLVDEEKLLAEYGKEAILSNPQKRQSMLSRYIFSPDGSLADFLRKKDSTMPDFTMPVNIWEWVKHASSLIQDKSLVREFYEYLIAGGKDEELHVAFLTKTSLTRERNWFVYQNGVVRNLADFPYPDPLIPANGFTLLENGQILISKGDSFMRISMEEGEDGYKRPKIEESHLTTPEPETIIPLIVWKKNKRTGEKSFYCGRFNQLPKHDTLLGQLVVAAYSQQVRDLMPLEIKMIGIDGEEKTQQMLEAQVPLLVRMQDTGRGIDYPKLFLTQSPVILGLEELAKNPAN